MIDISEIMTPEDIRKKERREREAKTTKCMQDLETMQDKKDVLEALANANMSQSEHASQKKKVITFQAA
jgi:hypothetical protein